MTARWIYPMDTTPRAPRCLCSHAPVAHEDRTGECWSVACGCQSVRFPSVEASMANHPSGKGLEK